MTQRTKNSINDWLTWGARLVLIYFATTINSKIESIDNIRIEQNDIKKDVKHLEDRTKNLEEWRNLIVNKEYEIRQSRPNQTQIP